MNKLLLMLAMATLVSAESCDKQPVPDNNPVEVPETNPHVSILALGDSYTIGHGVPVADRFPVQLQAKLTAADIIVDHLQISARTGWTTGDLQSAIAQTKPVVDTFDLVTLLIGVNNQFRGYPLDAYKTEFAALLETAIRFAGNRPERVLVLSIPDYGVTPFGQDSPNPNQISQQIDAFNAANRAITEGRGVAWFDITPISREAANDLSLLATDELHPSGKMYARWVELLLPTALEQLRP